MEQLQQEINDLEIQEAELDTAYKKDSDGPNAQTYWAQLVETRTQLTAKRADLANYQKQEAIQEAIEEKVHAEAVPFAVSGIDFSGLPAEVITLIDTVVKADRRRMLTEHASEMATVSDELSAVKQDRDVLADRVNELGAELGTTRADLSQSDLERKQACAYRDNAVKQLEDAQAEISRLELLVDEYQRAKLLGEREAQQIIDVTPIESTDITAAVAAVKKLYERVEDWGTVQKVIKPDGTFELATRQQLADEWQAADVPGTFRNEDPSAVAESDPVSTSETTQAIAPPPFPFAGVQEYTADGEVAATIAGQAETFEQEMRRRVSAVEAVVFAKEQGEAA